MHTLSSLILWIQRQRLEAQLAQHQANMMPRGVQSGIQPVAGQF